MKRLILLLSCTYLIQNVYSQKELTNCDIITQLKEIHSSFDNIVNKFKSKEDKISLVKTYFSEFSICGEKGKIKDYGKNVEFSFYYTDSDYKGGKNEFTIFTENLLSQLKQVFETELDHKISDRSDGKSWYFFEKGEDMTSSKRIVRLLLSYEDPINEMEAYSVFLVFEYYPKR